MMYYTVKIQFLTLMDDVLYSQNTVSHINGYFIIQSKIQFLTLMGDVSYSQK